MAKRNREAALKRARERARQEKKEAKRERQAARQDEEGEAEPVNEQALMEEFARLSERYEAGHVSNDDYDKERHRIFVDLGIEEEV
ncbi:MAG TPA: hypothetical protein VK969_04640 [Acidimicrobiia bacterium]|nr:hypothetical protein [Acidimicrobiia bacterium]